MPDAILGCVEIIDRRLPDRQAEAIATASLACLLAMAGDFEAARERYRAARDLLAELGGTVLTAFTAIAGARVELLDGDAAGAERELAPAYDALGRIGERYFRPLVGAYLARALFDTGKLEQAARVAADAAADADEDDVEAQALLRCVRARIEAQAGDPERAVRIVAAAVDAAQTTDSPVLQADILVEAGRVLATARRSAEAEAAFASAEALYRAKGDAVSAARLGETTEERLLRMPQQAYGRVCRRHTRAEEIDRLRHADLEVAPELTGLLRRIASSDQRVDPPPDHPEPIGALDLPVIGRLVVGAAGRQLRREIGRDVGVCKLLDPPPTLSVERTFERSLDLLPPLLRGKVREEPEPHLLELCRVLDLVPLHGHSVDPRADHAIRRSAGPCSTNGWTGATAARTRSR